ncbi:hypothetical protein HZA75_08000 [Candidatus Roizmanbacteria bacterium]|nr:hypothetical protein [Candidatus Roizmanbacteria bacterium]
MKRLLRNEQFAELIGMILGDGNLGNYPRCNYLRIYCNIKERQYANEIRKILEKVFSKKCYEYKRPAEGISYLEISEKDLDKKLEIPIGDKIVNKVKIPKWIFKKEKYIISCLRGLFDTDGCCYITGKKYRIVNFTNRNIVLLRNIKEVLEKLKFHPYSSGGRNIELGKQKEVNYFFELIKPRNLKHYRFNAKIAKVVKASV